jgi:hypothetical protein
MALAFCPVPTPWNWRWTAMEWIDGEEDRAVGAQGGSALLDHHRDAGKAFLEPKTLICSSEF